MVVGSDDTISLYKKVTRTTKLCVIKNCGGGEGLNDAHYI